MDNNLKRRRYKFAIEKQSHRWRPAGEDIVSAPEYCPTAITAYKETEKLGPNHKDQHVRASNVRKHLAFIGWKIEYLRYRNTNRIRYTSPSGDVYYSLRDICRVLSISTPQLNNNTHATTSSELISSPPERSQSCGIELVISTDDSDSDLCPEAVLNYFLLGQDGEKGNDNKDEKARSIALKAKRYLSAIGWRFDLRLKKGKQEKIYISPTGKTFYSLRAACGWCVKIGGLSCNKLLDQQETHVLVRDDEFKVHGNSRLSRKRKHSLLQNSSAPAMVQNPGTAYDHNRVTILSRMIDADVVLVGSKVQYRCNKDGPSLKEGRICREGIECSCCQKVFTLSKFEAHAGSKRHRPSECLFLEHGRSLMECRLQLKPEHYVRNTSHQNDYICSVCRDGGELLLCDKCPASFHASCLGLKDVPDGDWYCPSCCCSICSSRYKSGEQHRESNFANCGQCERQYHVRCLRNKGILRHHGGNWFCNKGCELIYRSLQELLGKPIPLGFDNLTWTLLKHTKPEDSNHGNPENRQERCSKLNLALKVMHECFEPVQEQGRDLVEDVIFNRWSNLNQRNFEGFYTMLMERNDQLITVATIRVHGEKVAEIPLIATRFKYRRQGMCRILMNALEKKLMELGVERLVLPAAPNVLSTWTESFGFSVMKESERLNLLGYTFLDFHGTTMCQKLLNSDHTEVPLSTGKLRGSKVSCFRVAKP